MIFITIGTQEPFDRLIETMDELAKELNIEELFVAQTFGGKYKVHNMKSYGFLNPVEFDELFNSARLIISHAGMGTVVSALTKAKPILVMPRRVEFGEHRNDHQMASAFKLAELGYIHVAFDENELKEKANRLIKVADLKPLHVVGKFASDSLIQSLIQFIHI